MSSSLYARLTSAARSSTNQEDSGISEELLHSSVKVISCFICIVLGTQRHRYVLQLCMIIAVMLNRFRDARRIKPFYVFHDVSYFSESRIISEMSECACDVHANESY